jgi:hypothetical protein
MTTIPHEPVSGSPVPSKSQWAEFLRIPEMWASLAISMMWLSVMIDAVYGPSFVSNDGTTIPSAIFLAFFAWLGSISVARYGLGRNKN